MAEHPQPRPDEVVVQTNSAPAALEIPAGMSLADFLTSQGIADEAPGEGDQAPSEVPEKTIGPFSVVTPETGKKKGEVTAADIEQSIQESCVEIGHVPHSEFATVAQQLERNPYIDYQDTRNRMIDAWVATCASRAFPQQEANRQRFGTILRRQFMDYMFVRGRMQEYVDKLNAFAQENIADTEDELAFLFSLDLNQEELNRQIAEMEAKAAAAHATPVPTEGLKSILRGLQPRSDNTPVIREIQERAQEQRPEESGLASITKPLQSKEQRRQEAADRTLKVLLAQPPIAETAPLEEIARYLYAAFNNKPMSFFERKLAIYSASRYRESAQLNEMLRSYLILDRHLHVHSIQELSQLSSDKPEKAAAVAELQRRLNRVSVVGNAYLTGAAEQVDQLFTECFVMVMPDAPEEDLLERAA